MFYRFQLGLLSLLFFTPIILHFKVKLVLKELMSQNQILVNTDEVQTTQS